jgi:hypothetical protein
MTSSIEVIDVDILKLLDIVDMRKDDEINCDDRLVPVNGF